MHSTCCDRDTSSKMKRCKASHFAFFVTGCVILILLVMGKTDVENNWLKMKRWPKLLAESQVSQVERPKTVVLFYTRFPGRENRDCCRSVETKEKCSLHHFDFTFDKQRFWGERHSRVSRQDNGAFRPFEVVIEDQTYFTALGTGNTGMSKVNLWYHKIKRPVQHTMDLQKRSWYLESVWKITATQWGRSEDG